MLAQTQDEEQIIARVAACDIGKAELVCCVRVPDEDRPGRRLQEVETYATMTRPLLGLADLWVPKTSSTSCGQSIFVDQTTDARLPSYAVLVEMDRLG